MPATYEPIATTTLGSAASSITFSSIPGTYTDLRVSLSYLGNSVVSKIRFNSDTGSNYSNTRLYGNGSSAFSARQTSVTSLYSAQAFASTSIPCFETYDIFSYAGSTNKTLLVTYNYDQNGSGGLTYSVGLWRNTNAITTIEISELFGGNFDANTTATLYGILKA